mmetsp:Transcript_118304/g.314836  ORF Transcript_118304/g.314836 Transcript_118304/m.314836 type:complete len:219 (-) Transcript_118304:796-1452(-)
MAARRQTIIQDICRPRLTTVFAKESVWSEIWFSASGVPPLEALSFTSATFFTTASSFILWVALSLMSNRLSPTMSFLIASIEDMELLFLAAIVVPSGFIKMATLCFMVLQSSPSFSMRSSISLIDSNTRSSAGLVELRCSPSMSTNRARWSVCDFWSRKCRVLSVSISMYVSWICLDTSLMSSPMEVSSMLVTSSCTTDTRSALAPSSGVPLQAVIPM